METISKEELKNYLHSYGFAVHCRAIYNKIFSNGKWIYCGIFNIESIFDTYSAYKLHDCVIIKDDNRSIVDIVRKELPDFPKRISYDIHQISNKADVCAAWHYILENEKLDDDVQKNIIIYACSPLPQELSKFGAWLKFTRKGNQFEDSNIRQMTDNDRAVISEFCEDSLNNDTDYGKQEAGNFHSWFESPYSKRIALFGIFNNNNLAGLVSVLKFEEVNFAQICDLFVNKENRRFGFGKRLVRFALGVYPNAEYIYQARRGNNASIELAKSLDFELAGAEIYIE